MWKALVARIIHCLTPGVEENLTPGVCMCRHSRNGHVKGKYSCKVQNPPDQEFHYWSDCACQIYIKDEDEGGEDTPTPSPDELERMFK